MNKKEALERLKVLGERTQEIADEKDTATDPEEQERLAVEQREVLKEMMRALQALDEALSNEL